jgi:uncharacterized protein YkwD
MRLHLPSGRRARAGFGALALSLTILVTPSLPIVAASTASAASPVEPCPPGAEWQFRDLVNAFRVSHGKPALRLSAELMRKAQAWTDHLVAIQGLTHSRLADGVSPGWTLLGENVAYASSGLAAAENGLEHSPPHYKNLVGDFTEMGLGVSIDARGFTWVTQVFARRAVPTAAYGGPAGPSAFTPVPPYTVFAPATAVSPGTVSRVKVTGKASVPLGATAVMAVLEATGASKVGWFQVVGPNDRPGAASNLNVDRGRGSATTITQVAADGTVGVVGSVSAKVRLTVIGFFSRTGSPVRAGRFVSVVAGRVLDTRPTSRVGWSGARPTAGSVLTVQVRGRGGVPTSGVRAVAVNLVAVDADGAGVLQVGKPGMVAGGWASMLLSRPSQTVSSLVVAPVDALGRIALRTTVGSHFVIDVQGWFTDGSAPASGLGLFVPMTAARVLDTRSAGPAAAGLRRVVLARRSGMPACPSGVFGNVTLMPQTTANAQIGPWGGFRAGVWSTLIGDTAALMVKNQLMVRVGTGGSIGVYTPQRAQVVVDLNGWFV